MHSVRGQSSTDDVIVEDVDEKEQPENLQGVFIS